MSAERLDDSWKIVIRIEPFSPICGLMRSVMPTSLRSIVWNGFESAVPVLVNWPVTNGTLLPTMILASSLSSVTRFGVDMMLVLACDCRKLAIAARPRLPKKFRTRPTLRPGVRLMPLALPETCALSISIRLAPVVLKLVPPTM